MIGYSLTWVTLMLIAPPVSAKSNECTDFGADCGDAVGLLQKTRGNSSNARIKNDDALELAAAKEYELLARGVKGCNDGFEITTIPDCQAAVKSIEAKNGINIPLSNTNVQSNVPFYCSVRIHGPANLYLMKFNPKKSQTYKGSDDLQPLCIAPPRGCDSSKCASAIGSDCCAPGGEEAACMGGYQVKMLNQGCQGFSNGAFQCCN